jgi:hypothetical protein
MIDDNQYTPSIVYKDEWSHAKCDKYDFMIATFCGGVAGLIDIFFVGDPLTSRLGKQVDTIADDFVKKAAHFFWNHDKRSSGKRKNMPQTLEQCISYLEQAFPVNYDARYAKDLNAKDGVLSGMYPLNHHLLSLAHSPDPIGLIFSIIDQFMGYATFVDKGKVIHVVPKKTSGSIPYMQGETLPAMLFCGFINWIGHLISDLVGSSSTRKAGKIGRGTGIPIPFYELFLKCDFGDIDGNTLSETMIKVFEEGYDFRFGAAMAIPVVLEELMIKTIWMMRQKFLHKKSWKESFPTKQHADLRIMLIIGNGTLCAIDGTDAAAHGLIEGGNIISFICHLNLVGWARLTLLILRELSIRLGPCVNMAIDNFLYSVLNILTPAEKEKIYAFRTRLNEYDCYLAALFKDFVKQVEKEYEELYLEINATFNDALSIHDKTEHSIRLADVSGVDNSKIIKSHEQLDNLF